MKIKLLTIILFSIPFYSCVQSQGYDYFMKYTTLPFALEDGSMIGNRLSEDGELAYMFFIKEDINSKINIMYVTDENYNVKYKMRFRDGEAELSKDGESSYLKNIDNPNAVLVMSKEDGISFYYLKKGNGGSISHYFATKVDSYATNKLLLKVSRNKENIHYKNLK